MPDQLPENIKKERSEVIRKISEENKLSFYSGFIGEADCAGREGRPSGICKGLWRALPAVEFPSD